ncbi:MAG TPA: tetratricopeptide repeat protein [Acetobacteraceae bacterium]|nr:tetratricopeptide repeat protein [Acetobacteraceae bacterium]
MLLVDNLDLVLGALPEDQHWQLRRVLQAAGGPILYGAAARALRQSGDQGSAFYEFFRIDVLEPLTAPELLRCLGRLAAARGPAGAAVTAILAREPERLRVLHTLTGGNPRILALIYQVLERAESETVFADLESLLDQLTPLYKSRVEELRTELQRSILDAVALHWDPITSHDLAAATGVEITTVSSQLSRLRDYGLVEEVPTSGARAGYQIVERFFNIWYLMRHGTRHTRQKMRWLTAFLKTFYSGDDLRRLRERFAAATAAGEWRELYGETLEAALIDVEPLPRPDRHSSLAVPDLTDLQRAANLGIVSGRLSETGDSAGALAAIREAVGISRRLTGENPEQLFAFSLAVNLHNLSVRLSEAGDSADALATIREAVDILRHLAREDTVRFAPYISASLVNLSVFSSQSGDKADALAAIREAVDLYRRLTKADSSKFSPDLATSLNNLSNRLGEARDRAGALAAIREAVDIRRRLAGENPTRFVSDLATSLGNLSIRLREAGEGTGALGAIREAVDLYRRLAGENPARFGPDLARSLTTLSDRLSEAGDGTDALAAIREAVDIRRRLAGEKPERFTPDLATSLNTLSNRLHQVGDSADELAAIREAVDLYRRLIGENAARFAPEFAMSLNNLSVRLSEAGDGWGALATVCEAVGLYRQLAGENPAHFTVGLAGSLNNLSLRLSAAGDGAGALAAIGEAEKALHQAIRFAPADARLWNYLGALLADHLGQPAEAEAAYRRAIEIGDDMAPIARVNLFWLLLDTDHPADARDLRPALASLDPFGLHLLDAGIALVGDNFGEAAGSLGIALDLDPDRTASPHFDDLLRLLRLFERRGYGERLIAWFAETGRADRHAPILAAFVAYVRGERTLLDVNPEVRQPALRILTWLASRRGASAAPPQPKQRRGRPPRRRVATN